MLIQEPILVLIVSFMLSLLVPRLINENNLDIEIHLII